MNNSSDNDRLRDNREYIREETDEQGAIDTNLSDETNANRGDSGINNTSAETNSTRNVQAVESSNESDSDNRNEMNIFDRFMDTILGANRNRVQSPVAIPIISGAGGDTTAVAASTTNASNTTEDSVSNPGLNTPNTLSTSADSNGGAIIITVNYVFSDENNPQNPNRSGSLVMTLPNNSSNRDPRIIQEFIRLATQMAYSTIVNMNKEKGITIDKFNSFEVKSLEELKESSKECSICFEDYLVYSNSNDKKRNIVEDSKSHEDIFVKKRKLNNKAESSSNISSPSTSSEPSTSSASTGLASASSDQNTSRPKYLSEFTGNFEHLPVQMPCGHIFGKSCLFEWLKNHSSCPLCRDSVSESNSSETSPNETNGRMQNNSNITMVHRPALLDIFNSFPRDRESNSPVRRILRSGNALGENNSSHTHTHTHSFPPQLIGSQDGTQESESGNQSGVFSHLLNYLRRSQLNENSEPLFPTGVVSRRTTNGVETRLTDRIGSEDNVLEFMNLRSLVDDNRNNNVANNSTEVNDGDNHNDNHNDNPNDNHNDNPNDNAIDNPNGNNVNTNTSNNDNDNQPTT